MLASSRSSHVHGRSRPRRRASHVISHAPKDRNASHGPSMIFRTFDASMCLIIELLLPMWDQNARRVRLAFRLQRLMLLTL
jgi:hypothetical protein